MSLGYLQLLMLLKQLVKNNTTSLEMEIILIVKGKLHVKIPG